MFKPLVEPLDVTYITDADVDSLISAYKDGASVNLDDVLSLVKKVFYSKTTSLKSRNWFRGNMKDIEADLNLFFYETIATYNVDKGAFLIYFYSLLPHFINNLYYRYSLDAGHLDRALQSVRNYALRFNETFPDLGRLKGQGYRDEFTRILLDSKKDEYFAQGFANPSQKAEDYLVNSGLRGAIAYLPSLLDSAQTVSTQYLLDTDPSFEIVEDFKISGSLDLDLLLKISLGDDLWATEALLEYLGVEGETTLRIKELATNGLASKKDLTLVIKNSFRRMSNPLIHFAYLSKFSFESDSDMDKVSPAVFSDF